MEKINPKIILCEISGYGRTGPYANKGGFDLVAQGVSGLMSITGESKEKPPMKVGAPLTDITAGVLGATGVLAALINREKTGKGQKVDTSLFEAGIIHTYWQSAIAGATGNSPGPLGSAHPLTAPYQAFKTKDKWITIGASNQNSWMNLIKALKREDLNKDERFSDNKNRMVAEIRHLLSKFDGNLGENGSVSWMFDKTGQIIMESKSANEDNIFEDAINDGAEDFYVDNNFYLVSTSADQLMEIRDKLDHAGYDIKSAEIEMVPKTNQILGDLEAKKVLKLLDALDDNDDVNKVYTNFDFA